MDNNEQLEELQKKFQRDINSLTEEDRMLRKKGLLSIQNDLFNQKNGIEIVLALFQKSIFKYLIKIFEDPIEKHREISLQIIEKFLEFSDKSKEQNKIDKDMISTIIKSLINRVNQIPFLEQSEEIRLQLIQLFRKILQRYPDEFLPSLTQLANMLQKILTDNYAEIKKEAAQFVIEFSNKQKSHIGYHSHAIIKSLLLNLQHQHSKVRKITMESLAEILLTDGCGPQIEHCIGSLNIIINDKINEVRKQAYKDIARVINGLSIGTLKNFEAQLVLLLINGLSDENPEIVQQCQELLEEVGLKRNVLGIEMEEENQKY